MISDLYQSLRKDSTINKLTGKGFLIVEYKCPVETEHFQLMTEQNIIMYIMSGKKDWTVKGVTFQVKEGDALFLRKGVYATVQYFEAEHCILLFFLNDDFIRRFMQENELLRRTTNNAAADHQIFPLTVDDSLKTSFYSIFNYLKLHSEVPQNLVELKFKELLYNIILNNANKDVTAYFASFIKNNKSNLEHIMMKHFQFDLQLEEFARLCGRSLSAFKRDFQNQFSKTPGKWLNEKRLEYAADLLLSSDMNINQVCFESGFRNASHFNKAFKSKYSLPPRQYRETKKENTLSGL